MATKKHQDPEEIKDLLREVEDDMAWESAKAFWQRHKGVLLALFLAVILAVAAGSWYGQHQKDQALEAESAFFTLVYPENQKRDQAINEAALPSSLGYHVLVALSEAQRHIKNDRWDEALSVWSRALKTAPAPFQHLLIVASRYAHLQKNAPQALSNEEAFLALSKNQSSPWYFLAQESMAFQFYHAKQFEEAGKIWEKLEKSDAAPQNVRQRAQTMQKILP